MAKEMATRDYGHSSRPRRNSRNHPASESRPYRVLRSSRDRYESGSLELARSAQGLAEEVESPKRKPSRLSSWGARRRERSTRSTATTIASTKSTESPNRRI